MSYIDKITNNDTGESRVISPAAEAVRVSNENYEGENLDEVLDEVAHAIEDAGSGDGTVTGVKVNGTTHEPNDQGVVDIGTVITQHQDISQLATKTEVSTGLASKANDNAVVKTISVNGGQAQTPTQGNVNINVQGIKGDDGITPHIGSNGNWWIGTTDTGINATGNDGQSITDADLVIRNALDGQGDVLGMSGAMRIKSNIDSLYTSLNRLYTKLANMAFWDATDQAAAAPTALDWSVPKKTVTLALTLSNAVVKNNGQEVSSSVQVDEGSGLTLTVEPASGYALTDAPTVSTGATVTDNGNGTYSVAIASVDADMTLSITATGAAARSVTINRTGCSLVSGPTSIINGGGGTFVFAANENYTLPISAPTVVGASIATNGWDSTTGTLVISGVSGNVEITIVCAYSGWLVAPKNDVMEGSNVVTYGMQQGRSLSDSKGCIYPSNGSSKPNTVLMPAAYPTGTKRFPYNSVGDSAGNVQTNPGKTTSCFFATGGKRYVNIRLTDTQSTEGYTYKFAVGCYGNAVINNSQADGFGNTQTLIDGFIGRWAFAAANNGTMLWKIDLNAFAVEKGASAGDITYIKLLLAKQNTDTNTDITSDDYLSNVTIEYKFSDD